MERLLFVDSVTRTIEGYAGKTIRETTKIKIKLADDCKNGHQDFSITCDIYENGRDVGGGCAHDHINDVTGGKYRIFIDLHLSDCDGIPMYAVENGFYHIKREPENVFLGCYYPGITAKQYTRLVKAEDQTEYAILLNKLGILKTWKKKADKAIKLLEKLTGEKFTRFANYRSQYHAPTPEQIADFEAKKKSGYFTDAAKLQRKIEADKAAFEDAINKIEAARVKAIDKIKEETAVKLWVLRKLGKPFNNFIYYNHTAIVNFNWMGHEEKISYEEFKAVFGESGSVLVDDSLPRPVTVTFEKM